MRRERHERRWLLVGLSLSLAAHAGLLAISRRVPRTLSLPRTAPPAPLRAVAIELRAPPPPAEARTRPPPPSASPTAARAEPAASAPSGGTAHSDGEGSGSPQGGSADHARRGPRRLRLFDRGAIGIAAAPERLEGDALAEARIDGWAEDFAAAQRAIDQTAAVGEMKKRFGDWFLPSDAELVASAPWGVGLGSGVMNALDFGRALPRIGGSGDLDPLKKTVMDKGKASGGYMALCFGNCFGIPNAVHSLRTLVEVRHDPSGRPERWRVVESSGRKGYDAAALDAIGEGMQWADAALLATDRPAVMTRWAFVSTAYRWSRFELMADPLLIPPGREIDEDATGKTTVVREVTLVAVIYAPAGDPGLAPGD